MLSKLQEAIARIPPDQRFITGNGKRLLGYYCEHACVFGYGNYANTWPFEDIPPWTKGLYFYYGSDIKDLLQEILKLPLINNLEYLVIGITRNNANYYSDYSEISAFLANSYFPNLKFFEYGVDELIANEHCMYGNLGDITTVLQRMPNLEKLYLHGNFELTSPVALPCLTDLEAVMNDHSLNINGGKITNATLQHILSSKLDALQLMSLYLDLNDTLYDYTIPHDFLAGQHTPALKTLELRGNFKAGTTLMIEQSLFLKKLDKVFIDGIEEPTP